MVMVENKDVSLSRHLAVRKNVKKLSMLTRFRAMVTPHAILVLGLIRRTRLAMYV
jgi:hypothetical protein